MVVKQAHRTEDALEQGEATIEPPQRRYSTSSDIGSAVDDAESGNIESGEHTDGNKGAYDKRYASSRS